MPGRLMSIRTTSGGSLGSAARASSALACWLRQRKPSARLITRASVPRNWSLSSTMETVIDMLGGKLQTPNFKLQGNTKFQIPNESLGGFGAWCLKLLWSLELEV